MSHTLLAGGDSAAGLWTTTQGPSVLVSARVVTPFQALPRLQKRQHRRHPAVSSPRLLRTGFSTVPPVTHRRRPVPASERPSAMRARTSRWRVPRWQRGSARRRACRCRGGAHGSCGPSSGPRGVVRRHPYADDREVAATGFTGRAASPACPTASCPTRSPRLAGPSLSRTSPPPHGLPRCLHGPGSRCPAGAMRCGASDCLPDRGGAAARKRDRGLPVTTRGHSRAMLSAVQNQMQTDRPLRQHSGERQVADRRAAGCDGRGSRNADGRSACGPTRTTRAR